LGECLVALAVWPLSIRTAAGEGRRKVPSRWLGSLVPVERIELPTFGLQNPGTDLFNQGFNPHNPLIILEIVSPTIADHCAIEYGSWTLRRAGAVATITGVTW
jgi:hypothetical protein